MRDSTHTPARIRAIANGLVIMDCDVRQLVIEFFLKGKSDLQKTFSVPITIITTLPTSSPGINQYDTIGDEHEDV